MKSCVIKWSSSQTLRSWIVYHGFNEVPIPRLTFYTIGNLSSSRWYLTPFCAWSRKSLLLKVFKLFFYHFILFVPLASSSWYLFCFQNLVGIPTNNYSCWYVISVVFANKYKSEESKPWKTIKGSEVQKWRKKNRLRWTRYSAYGEITLKTHLNTEFPKDLDAVEHIPLPERYDVREEFETLAEDIKQAILELKNRKAPGNDAINVEALKAGVDEIVTILLKIFQRVFQEESTPPDWSKMLVTPIYKKRDLYDTSNYRAISLLSIPEKVFNKVILEKIRELSVWVQAKSRHNKCGIHCTSANAEV